MLTVSCDHNYSAQPAPPSGQLEATPNKQTNKQLEVAQKETEARQNEVKGLKTEQFCLERFSDDPKLINFYTGFIDYKTFVSVFTALQPTASTLVCRTQVQEHSSMMDEIKMTPFKDECTSLTLIDQFFMFMCNVRQGFHEQDLAVRFNVSEESVCRILITWTKYLYVMFKSLSLWPSRRTVDQNMPECFKCTYPNTRVILDCSEISVQTPSSKVIDSEMYVDFQSHTTYKSLVGITPSGSVSFVSPLYPGGISAKDITAKSGILDRIEPNDQVMVDKGFQIQDLLEPKHATVVIPPFLGQKGKFSQQEVSNTHEIARLQMHVERAIHRIKDYHIFDKVVPFNFASTIDQIWTVCTILTNFRGSLLQN